MKASLLINLPLLSRKCKGLKLLGFSHSVSSYRTDVRRGITAVPCNKIKHIGYSNININIKTSLKEIQRQKKMFNGIKKRKVADLFEKVALKDDIFTYYMRKSQGNDVGKSL